MDDFLNAIKMKFMNLFLKMLELDMDVEKCNFDLFKMNVKVEVKGFDQRNSTQWRFPLSRVMCGRRRT